MFHIHSRSLQGLWKLLLCIYSHTIYKYMLYIRTFFPPSYLYLFVLLQQTVMQYQLSDDLPSALPFRLFPTIERDNGGRSDSSRVHYQSPVPARFLIVLFDSIKHSWMTHSCCTEVRVLFWFFFSSPAGCWCIWNFAVTFHLEGQSGFHTSVHVTLTLTLIEEHLLLWCPESGEILIIWSDFGKVKIEPNSIIM